MRRQAILSLPAMLALILPTLASAQYHFDGASQSWNRQQQVPVSGPPSIVFPVEGGATFHDDFGDPRSGGRVHEGNDLLAPKMTRILAARGGRVVYEPMTEPSYGYMITIAGDDGYTYNYIHINNDTPGTDDGAGGVGYAYAPGIVQGVQVAQGQHIAWVGDSGDAENVSPHLHFEIRLQDGTAIDPYPYLQAALNIFTYDIAAAKAGSPTIDADKGLVAGPGPAGCVDGTLVRARPSTSVYYCGADGKRYVFPNPGTYATWYKDFSTVKDITPDALAQLQLGGNVTYRPGVRMVKITTDPKVYAVDKGGTLRWMESEALAAKYYGAGWAKLVDDVPDTFFTNYKVGDPITD